MTPTTVMTPAQQADLARLLKAPQTREILDAADREAAERRAKVLKTRTDTLERLAKERKSAKIDERVAATAENVRAAEKALHAAKVAFYEARQVDATNVHLAEVADHDAQRALWPLGGAIIRAATHDLSIVMTNTRALVGEGRTVERTVGWMGRESEFLQKYPEAKTAADRIAAMRAEVEGLLFSTMTPAEIRDHCGTLVREALTILNGFPEQPRGEFMAPPPWAEV